MSDQAKIIQLLGDEMDQFEADNIVLQSAKVNKMGGQTGHRSNFTEWKRAPYIKTAVDGLDLPDSAFNELTRVSIPYKTNIYSSVAFELTNTDTLDSPENRAAVREAYAALDARINRAVANTIWNEGAQVVTHPGAINSFSDISEVDTLLGSQDIPANADKTLAMNYRDANTLAGDLAGRQTVQNTVKTAYEKAKITEVAAMDVLKTSFTPTAAAAQGAGITVTGAQSYTPIATITASNGEPVNVDNRSMPLQVSSTAGVVPGDKFVINNGGTYINAMSMINKDDTGNRRVFTVKAVNSGTELEVSPPIIVGVATATTNAEQARKDYANCSDVAANAATLEFINTTATQTNLFWVNDGICLNTAPVLGSGNDIGGMLVMNETTEQGLNIVVAKQGRINDLSTKWRMSTFFGVTVDPLWCGSMLGSQA